MAEIIEPTPTSKNLFDIIPKNLFQPLAAQSRRLYAAILQQLYQLIQTSMVVEEEAVVDTIMDVLALAEEAEREALLADEMIQNRLQAFDTADLEDDPDETYRQQRAQARAILRYLETTGWLMKEQQHDYRIFFTFPDYTFPLLKSFQDVVERQQTEFEGKIYGVFLLLIRPEQPMSPYVLLQQAHEQTRQIATGLKQLQHNIGDYIKQLASDLEVNQILQNFSVYREEVAPNYYRLKTADHISRYRLAILRAVQGYETNHKWLYLVIQELQKRQPELSEEKASQQIHGQLNEIQNHFNKMDDIMRLIDKRHQEYAIRVVSQVRYSVEGGQNLTAQLTDLCQLWATEAGKPTAVIEPELQTIFRLFQVNYTSRKSLRYPSRERTKFEPTPVVTPKLDARTRKSVQAKMSQEVENLMTPGRVWAYLKPHLADHDEVDSQTLLKTEEDWLMLIGLRIYADSADSPYECLEPPAEQYWVQYKSFRCPNFQWMKK